MQSLWAYAYQIVPPQPSGRLGGVRALLRAGAAAARDGARTWSGRLVFERRATHILIVSDDPERDHAINLRLEAELLRLDAPFSITKPLMVMDQNGDADTLAPHAGNGREGSLGN